MKKSLLAATITLTALLAPIPALAAEDTGQGITRMEAARAFSKLMSLPFASQQHSPFSDVKVGQEGWNHIAAIQAAGLMTGDGTGAFYPDRTITREELAVLMVRSFGLTPAPHEKLDLQDADAVSDWARDWVGTAIDLGLMQTFGDDFKPAAVVTPADLTEEEDRYWSREIVTRVVGAKRAALQAKDKAGYLAQLDPAQTEYQAEQEHWFHDFVRSDIEDYRVQIGRVQHDDDSLLADLHQTYQLNGKSYALDVQERFVLTDDGWRDGDLNFATKATDHFTIKYLPGDEDVANVMALQAEAAYADLQAKLPFESTDKTMIKVYNDLEQLRQSVKLSFAWNFAGWYEYPEAIKLNSVNGIDGMYANAIEHESIHKVTLAWANNNIPYWLSEGLATYYASAQGIQPREGFTYKSMRNLEQINLETLTDNAEVSQYYHNASVIVSFLVDAYGDAKVRELLQALGRYPLQNGTGADNDPLSKQRFAEAVPNVFGKSVDALDSECLQWVQQNQQ